LREALAIREKKNPDDWFVFSIKSLLGASLSSQKRFAEAEPLLLASFAGLSAQESKIPLQSKKSLREALLRIVGLYEAWGKAQEAEKWRAKLAQGGAP
jgi:hypothetical protein